MASKVEVFRTFAAPLTPLTKELPRVILLVLFCFAAIDKFAHFSRFANALQSYHLLPAGTERYTAVFIIMTEFAVAFGLLTRRWRRSASLSAIVLLAIFTTVYLIAHPEWVCGCWFTLTLAKGGTLHILQNLAFVGLAILAWLDSQTLSTGTKNKFSSTFARLNYIARQADGGKPSSIR